MQLLTTTLLPSVLLFLLMAAQSNCFTINFNLGDLFGPKSDLELGPPPCNQCSKAPPISDMDGLKPNAPVAGVDASGCSTLLYVCPVKAGGQAMMMVRHHLKRLIFLYLIALFSSVAKSRV